MPSRPQTGDWCPNPVSDKGHPLAWRGDETRQRHGSRRERGVFPPRRAWEGGVRGPDVRSEPDRECGLYPAAKGYRRGYSGAMGEGAVQQGPEPSHPHTHSNSKHKRGGTPGEGAPSDPHGTQRWTVRRVPPKMIKGAGTLGRKGVLRV